jgi:hypothetical protein
MPVSSAQIKFLPRAIADIYLPSSNNEPGSIAEVLRPLLLEMRRSRMTGEPMRKTVLDRFSEPASA